MGTEERKRAERMCELNALYKKYDYLYRGVAGRFGLSDAALGILYFVRMADGACSQSEICSLMMHSKQTVNSAIKRLEEEGLLVLACGEGNKKNKLITLTAAGETLAEKTADRVIRAEQAALDGLTEEEQGIFLKLFAGFVGRLETEMDALREAHEEEASE